MADKDKPMSQKDIEEAINPTELMESIDYLKSYWQIRNDYIRECRNELEGLVPISLPQSTQYKAQAIHLYLLTSIINEKVARYMDVPNYQVLIPDLTDSESVKQYSELERALNIASYEMERIGGGDVWGRTILDAVLLDQGVYKMQMAPAAYWRELVVDAKNEEHIYPMQSEARDLYKKEKGIPIRRSFVPLENFLPQYDGARLDFSFEIEGRSVYSTLKNTLFDQDAIKGLITDGSGGRNQQIPIIHYNDENFYAYFALAPREISPQSPLNFNDLDGTGMKFLYGYETDIGRSVYNDVGGRYGGWKTQFNRIEGVNKGMLSLAHHADNIASQILTGIRAKNWPNLKFNIDPELRGYQPGGAEPQAPTVQEGQEIVLFKGEDLAPIFEPRDDPSVPWMMDLIKEQLGKLGGSSVLYGQNQAGVDTGYHNAQQVSMAEHLDEKLEQHIVQGAIIDGTLIMLYVRALGEEVFAHYAEQNGLLTGKKNKVAKYVSIKPELLSPLPRLDARVRKPRPIDFTAAIRAAREASDDRQGKGPLMPDISIRSDILARESPDMDEALVLIQGAKNDLIKGGFLSNRIQIATNMKLAKQNAPAVTPGMGSQIDPALQNAAAQFTQQQGPGLGGVNPQTQAELMNNNNMHTGGMMPTDSQPEARVGEAVQGAMGGRP